MLENYLLDAQKQFGLGSLQIRTYKCHIMQSNKKQRLNLVYITLFLFNTGLNEHVVLGVFSEHAFYILARVSDFFLFLPLGGILMYLSSGLFHVCISWVDHLSTYTDSHWHLVKAQIYTWQLLPSQPADVPAFSDGQPPFWHHLRCFTYDTSFQCISILQCIYIYNAFTS